jgi:hypothetical protein
MAVWAAACPPPCAIFKNLPATLLLLLLQSFSCSV